MLEARSVAVVGASTREGTVGNQSMLQLVGGGFDGDVWAVNPKYTEVLDRPCFGSLDDLPGAPDLAILAVSNARLEEQLRSAVAAGARSAVVFASAEGTSGDGAEPLIDRVAALAREAGIAVCGANCMGFANFERGLRALGFAERFDIGPGPVAWISHSGSAFTALLHNDRGLRFGLAVSSGHELTTTASDYLTYAVERPGIRVAALFLETIRDPEGFRSALDLAAARDVAVVALKVGREPVAREMVAAHSGALAGEDGVLDAVFESHGVARVATFGDLAETVELLCAGRRAGPGGLASVHDSGGERAHFVDVAAGAGVAFARISAETTARLAEVLEPGLLPANPLDAWGTGNDYERIFLECIRALLDDPDTAALAFVVDLAGEELDQGYTRVALEASRETTKPFAVLSNLPAAIDRAAGARLRAGGVPVLEGTTGGLAAFRALLELRDARALQPPAPAEPVAPEVRDRWRDRLTGAGEPWSEVEAMRLLADYGIPAVRSRSASSEAEAAAAAAELGWPVVVKTAGVAHKSDVDGVRLGIRDEAELRVAYADLASRLGPGVTLAETAAPGVELALGMVRDPHFGPVVVAAAGGVLVEVLRDRRTALIPVDEVRAGLMVDRLAVRPLLDGVRGSPPADLAAVAHAIVRLSVLAADLGDLLDAVDVNPLIAGPAGCVAVDALVVPRSPK